MKTFKLIYLKERVTRWKNYLEELFNSEIPVRLVPPWMDYNAE